MNYKNFINLIIEQFNAEYGFAPARKNIIPLESGENEYGYDFLAFRVGKVGYTFHLSGHVLTKTEWYNQD